MKIRCVWEHNGNDTLLYADNFAGAFTRGESKDVPRTAREMYEHTRNVNAYYFEEIGVMADNEGDILECRKRGFELLEQQPDYLENKVFEGRYDEFWSLRKVLRRFIWHDRIHAKAMYRMAVKTFGGDSVEDVFRFGGGI